MRRLSILVGACLLVLVMAPASVAQASGRRVSTASSPAVGTLPVVSCRTSFGAEPSSPFVARRLPATTDLTRLAFYSNGFLTVLGPAGWACGALVAADGGEKLDVFPPGQPDYSTRLPPKGAVLVELEGDYTGHLPGAELVCALFPNSAAAAAVRSSGLPCPSNEGEKVVHLTPDVVTFTDPPGVTGSGAGSGGSLASQGAAVYPQLQGGSADSVDITLLACTLPQRLATLCGAIEGDYVVRNPPQYVPQAGG